MIAARLEMFVRDLKLPWRWLALELADQYCVAQFVRRLFGRALVKEHVLGMAPARPFQPLPGEDIGQAFTRYAAAVSLAAKRYVTARRRPKRGGEKFQGDHLERYAECFYRPTSTEWLATSPVASRRQKRAGQLLHFAPNARMPRPIVSQTTRGNRTGVATSDART